MNWFTNATSKIMDVAPSLKQAINSASSTITKTLKEQEETQNGGNYGITPALVEFIQNICQHPNTFRDFPLDKYDVDGNMTEWQVNHAKIILEQVEELRNLRFKLCPSFLREDKFWKIYFLLVRNKLGEIKAATSSSEVPPTPRTAEKVKAFSLLSPFLDLSFPLVSSTSSFASPNSKSTDIEDYFDEIFQSSINNSTVTDEGIDPDLDSYFVERLSFDSDDEENELPSQPLNSSTIDSLQGNDALPSPIKTEPKKILIPSIEDKIKELALMNGK